MKPKHGNAIDPSQLPGTEYLAEETLLLYQLLSRYYVTHNWTFLSSSKMRELMLFMYARGLLAYTPQQMLEAVLRGLHELQDWGFIGCYQDEKRRNHVRLAYGQVLIQPHCSQTKLVNNLICRFGFNWFRLDAQARAGIGQCLRDGGYDWENMSQLNASVEAICRKPLDLIEVYEQPSGIYIARLTLKVELLNEQELDNTVDENRRLRDNSGYRN